VTAALQALSRQPAILLFVGAVAVWIFFWGVLNVLKGFRGTRSIRHAMARLRADPGQDVSGPVPELRRLAALAARLEAARQARVGAPEIDRDVALIERSLVTPVTRIRAIAGILIIFGLLLTLFNLRSAVLGMQRTFDVPIDNRSSAGDGAVTDGRARETAARVRELNIQRSMQEIVGSAGTAFAFSAVAISSSVALLIGAILLSSDVERTVALCREWLNDRAYAITNAARSAQSADPTAALLGSLQTLNRLSTAFEQTSEALADLRGFGDSMTSAAEDIRGAVVGLPAHIGESVGQLSTNVTYGISQQLERQWNAIQSLIQIYGDQHGTLKKIVDAVSTSSDAAKEAAQSAKDSQGRLAEIATSMKEVAAAASSATRAADQLQSRVAELPIAEMRHMVAGIENRTISMEATAKAVGALEPELKTLIADLDRTVSAAGAAADGLGPALAELQRSVGSLARIGQAHSADLGSVRTSLEHVAQALLTLQKSDVAALDVLQNSLGQLTQKIDALPSVALKRVVSRYIGEGHHGR
jgi:hypothetical protein